MPGRGGLGQESQNNGQTCPGFEEGQAWVGPGLAHRRATRVSNFEIEKKRKTTIIL
jgi:hypothetical protein